MNLKKLFLMLTFLALMGTTAFAQVYVSASGGNDGFPGTQAAPYRSITKAIASAADGSTVYVEAGTYNAALTGEVEPVTFAVAKTLTFVSYQYGLIDVATITNGFVVNDPDAIVNMGLTGAKWDLGTLLTLTDGTMNITTANVALASGATLTFTEGFLNAPPTVTTDLNVTFDGGTAIGTTAAFMPSNIGLGTLTFNQSAGSITVDNASLTTGTITVTGAGDVSITGNLVVGSATLTNAKDILNSSGASLTIGGSTSNTLTLFTTIDAVGNIGADAYVGEIVNSAGSVTVVNSTITFNIANDGTSASGADSYKFAATRPLISNTAATPGSLTINGDVTFANTNVKGTSGTINDVTHTVIVSNGASGDLSFNGSIFTPASSASFTTKPAIYVVLSNTGGGTFATRSAALRGTAGVEGVSNKTAAGTMTLGQAGDTFTTDWNVMNDFAASKLVINANSTFGGDVTNNDASSIIEVANNGTTIEGLLTNSGKIKLFSNKLTLSLSASDALNNIAGSDIYSSTSGAVGNGWIVFTGDVASMSGTGKLPNIEVASATSWTNANAITIYGAFSVTGGGVATIGATTTVKNGVNMTLGDITLGADLSVAGTFTMPQGTFTFSTFTLNLAGDFNRTGGTIDAAAAGTGTLNFNGTVNQSFTPGVQMNVYNVTVNNAGAYLLDVYQNNIVTFNGSLMVKNDFTITDGQVNLGTSNIRMLQTAGSARFTNNDLGYTATGIGGIMFEGNGAIAGAGTGPVILGTQPFSNIWITFTDASKNVFCLGDVYISGDIHFVSGGLTWNQPTVGGDAFTTSTLTLDQSLTGTTVYPSAFITTNNAHGSPYFVDGADLGASAMTITPRFNLVYDGTADITIGATDFITAKVNNLAIQTSNTNTVTFIAGNGTIKGSLIVDNDQTLQLTNGAARTLTADGSVTHTVNGTVTGGTVIISGATATLTGGVGTGNASKIADLQLTGSTLFTSTGMKEFTALTVNNSTLTANITMNAATATVNALTHTTGTLNLNMNSTAVSATGNYSVAGGTATITMNGAAAATATIGGTLGVSGGTLALGSHIWVTGNTSQSATGKMSFGDYNLTLAGTYTHSGTGTITAGKGALVAKAAVVKTYTFTTTVDIPNFTVNYSAAGIQFVTNGLKVTNAFVHTAGDVDLNGLPLTITGNTYTYTAGTYSNTAGTATAIVSLRGDALNVTAAADPSYPYLDVNSTGTVTLKSSSTSTPRNYTVTKAFTHTKGDIALGFNDIKLTDNGAAGASYSTVATAGTVTGTATGTNLGEVTFSGAFAHNLTLAAAYSIQNVNVAFATTKTDTKVLTVGSNFTLGANFTFTTTANVVLGDGAIITRSAGVFDVAPTFGTTVNVVYTPAGALNTSKELPTTTTVLNDLTISSGAPVLAADAQVNGTLYLKGGTFSTGTKVLTIATDATINRSAGAFAGAATDVPTVTTYKLVYSGSTAIAATGAELVDSPTAVTSLTVSMTANGVMLGADATVGTFSMSPTGVGASAVYFLLGTDAAPLTLTVTGTATIDDGIISTQDATIAPSVDAGTLKVEGGFTVNGGVVGNFGTDNGLLNDGGLNLSFNGAAAQSLTLPGNTTISNLTIDNTGDITLVGGNLKVTGTVTFTKGILRTGDNILYLAAPTTAAVAAGTQSQGFVDASATSHVVGNVAKVFVNSGGIAGSTEATSIFPVGTGVVYRPASVTFNPAFGVPTTPNATIVVSHVDSNPGGSQALPIVNGVAAGIDVSRYPNFYWNIYTIGSISQSTVFDLGLTAGNFTDYDSPSNVRIIRRHGAVGDLANDWLLQGVNTGYDNEVNSVTGFTAINRNSVGGLRTGGAVFTLGVKSNISVQNAIAKQWLVIPQGAKLVSLANVFQGNIGTLSFTAQSSNPAVATAAISGTSVTLTPLTIGEAFVTITAVDAANNDFFAYTFAVDSRNTDVATTEEIPTEFALSQNFPNPFNPTTNIKFALPKESNVTLKIYNILGEEVANLVNKVMPAGYHTVNFDATRLASGMYIYRIEAGSFVQVKKMLLMK